MPLEQGRTLAFIEQYKSMSLLWDINYKDYINVIKINDTVNQMAANFNIGFKQIRIKIKNWWSYFLREHQKVTQMKSGAGAEDVYESRWFIYKPMLFVKDSITPCYTKHTIVEYTDKVRCHGKVVSVSCFI